MKKEKYGLQLTDKQLQTLLNYFDARVYNVDADLIYKGHIPLAGFVLLQGSMILGPKKRRRKLDKGTLVGLRELLNDTPYNHDLKICSGSQVIILDRSSVLEALDEQKNELTHIMQELVS